LKKKRSPRKKTDLLTKDLESGVQREERTERRTNGKKKGACAFFR